MGGLIEAVGGLTDTSAVATEESEVHKTTEEDNGKLDVEVEIGKEMGLKL